MKTESERTEEPENKRDLILVVDDVTKNIQILGNFLREAEYDVAVATSGMQALSILEQVKPQLILLDIMMPGLDGYETCRRIKQQPGTHDIPIIFVTAKTDTEDIVRGFELGAVDYITKPFSRPELLARVRTHLELMDSRRQLFRALRDKDKFFSIIAHDLRGPLGSFMSIAEYLSENLGELDIDEVQPLLMEMRNTGRGVYRLLENLLEWSRIQLGTISYNPVVMSFNEILDSISVILETQAARKDITFSVTGDASVQVHADHHMISTVIRNLVQNAIKYTDRGGSILLSLHSSSDDDVVTVSVIDNGVGMDEMTTATLFDITNTRSLPGTEKEKGTGLGLILCKELISMHGQKLSVASEAGRGSTFTFTLLRGEE
jgi:two-component system, sensor histidine kinase and response regulator